MELIKVKQTYTDKDGVQRNKLQFYIVVDGLEKPIAIEPHSYGSKGNTYNALNLVAKYVSHK